MESTTRRELDLSVKGITVRLVGRYGNTYFTADFPRELQAYITEPRLDSREEAVAYAEGVLDLWKKLKDEIQREKE